MEGRPEQKVKAHSNSGLVDLLYSKPSRCTFILYQNIYKHVQLPVSSEILLGVNVNYFNEALLMHEGDLAATQSVY